MGFNELVEKIESSKIFKKFKEEHQDAELCAGFFIVSSKENENKNTLDYKTKDEIFTFTLQDNGEITFQREEIIKTDRPLEKIEKEIKIDLEKAIEIGKKKIKDERISKKVNKIIAVLQKYKDKEVWNLTYMLEGLSILNILINALNGEVLKFKEKSLIDLVKKKE